MRYTVRMTKTVTSTGSITISAADEDDAQSKAEKICEKDDRAFEWELDDETYEVQEVEEADDEDEE